MDDLRLVIKEEAPNSHTDSSPLDMNVPSSSNSGSSSGSLEDTLRNSIDIATFDEINKMISYVSEMSEIGKLYFLMKLPGSAIPQNNANANYNPFGLSNQSEMNHASVWIHSHLETDQTVCLRKDEVYQEYRSYCDRHSIKSLNTADFGKAMKRCFPNVKPRRLGQRGHSKYCYGGLKKKTNVEPPQLTDMNALLGRSPGDRLTNLLPVDEAHANILLNYINNALGRTFNCLDEAAKIIGSQGENLKDDSANPAAMRQMLTSAKAAAAVQGSPTMSHRPPGGPGESVQQSLASLARPEARRTLATGSLSRTASSPSQRLDAGSAPAPNFSTPPGRSSHASLTVGRPHLAHEPSLSPHALALSPYRSEPPPIVSMAPTSTVNTAHLHQQLFSQQYQQRQQQQQQQQPQQHLTVTSQGLVDTTPPYYRQANGPALHHHQQPQQQQQQVPTSIHMSSLLGGAIQSPILPAPLRHPQAHPFPLQGLGSPIGSARIGPQHPQSQSPLGLLSRQQPNMKCDGMLDYPPPQIGTPPQAHMTAAPGTPVSRPSFNVPPPMPAPQAPVGVGSSPFNSGTLMRSAAPPPPPACAEDPNGKRPLKRHPGIVPNDCKYARLGASGRLDLDVAAVEKDATYEPDWSAAALSPLGPHDSDAANGSGGPPSFFQLGGGSGSSDFEDFFCDTPGCPTGQEGDEGRQGTGSLTGSVRISHGRLEVGSSPCPSPTQHAVAPYSAGSFVSGGSGLGFVKMEPPSTPKSAERTGRPIASLSQRLEDQPVLGHHQEAIQAGGRSGEEEEERPSSMSAVSRLHADLSTPVPMRTPTPTQAAAVVPLMPQ